MSFDRKLIPNYVFAGATIGVFLWASVFALINSDSLITSIESTDPKTAFVVGGIGATIITALLLNVRDIYIFFFKKSPS